MKIKRNKSIYKWFLCGLILVVVLTITLIKGSRAGYKSTASIELTSGVVKYSSYDFNLISMYIDGVEQDKTVQIPIDGYRIDETNSYCYKESKSNKDNNAHLYTNEFGNHVFEGISKGSKCILYFNKIDKSINPNCGSACEYILSKVDDIKVRRRNYKAFNVPFEDTNNYIYKAPDDDGTSYYFAGNPTNNWVEFGGYYWRIIRINGDGSIRMIYQGRTKDESGNKLEPQATGEETQIGTIKFNEKIDDNAYVGYFYNEGQLRGLDKPSNAYTYLNDWYKETSNLKNYEQYIDLNAGFCGDRTPYSDASGIMPGSGIGITTTIYGAFIRLLPKGNSVNAMTEEVKPSFNCTSQDDLYTYSGANQGNRKLENPVGLITADEASYAGIVRNASADIKSNYLCTGKHYWTITPFWHARNASNYSYVFLIFETGFFEGNSVAPYEHGIRPVINIRSDVNLSGNGTQSNPYKVVS